MGNEYLDFVKALQQHYLEQRDMENILSSIDENTSWIGTGRQEICKSFSDAENALLLEKREYDGGFTVSDSWYETMEIAENICVVYGEFWAAADDRSAGVADLHHRLSAMCSKTDKGIKLLHLHMSTPDDDQESSEYYAKSKKKMDNQILRIKYAQTMDDLHNQSRELEILTSNIPGGVHKCKNDDDFTLVSMSNGFLDMFGYTREEITALFGNRYMQMICECDRAAVSDIMKKQLSHGKTVEFEYRVRCKNGSIVWVLDRGRLAVDEDGSEFFYCMMMDITRRKLEDEQLRLALERHRVIMDQATDVIFEWDIQADTMDYSSNWEKRFGYAPTTKNISRTIPGSNDIHPDDMHLFVKLMEDTAAGTPYSETEFRIRNTFNEYNWCRIRATTQFDSNNHPIKAVGVIVNIDEEKSRSRLLLEAAQRDSLTQLYNKVATKTRIEKILESKGGGSIHALMMIDVDNFKNINDNFGHQCGDAVLANMAKALKSLFRSSDVVGRIGGDEFLVFMADVNSRDLVSDKAKEIVRIFGNMPIEIGGELSCSVGVSLYPQDGADYASLYRCADKALYGVKNEGKVNYAFYNKSLSESLPFYPIRTAIGGKIDSEDSPINKELMQHVFQLLYNASDTEAIINNILEMVGRTFNVSRAYIFENSEDGCFCSNTFEWCNDGISSEMNKLQNLSFETDLAGFFDCYDESGVFYCQDIAELSSHLRSILQPQGVVSVLQCFIKDNGVFKGYVGFDECQQNRYWTMEQINTLSTIANLLSTFLVKQRLNEQVVALRLLQRS